MSEFKVGDEVIWHGPHGVTKEFCVEHIAKDGWLGDGARHAYDPQYARLVTSAVDPDHYTFGGAQVIDITRHLGFLEGNVIKYVARAGRKGERLEDLKKAEKYLRWAIEDAS